MESDRIEALLEEIRDLKQSHLDLYKEALEGQRSSIEAQQEAIAYQKRMGRIATMVVLPLIALVIAVLIWILRLG